MYRFIAPVTSTSPFRARVSVYTVALPVMFTAVSDAEAEEVTVSPVGSVVPPTVPARVRAPVPVVKERMLPPSMVLLKSMFPAPPPVVRAAFWVRVTGPVMSTSSPAVEITVPLKLKFTPAALRVTVPSPVVERVSVKMISFPGARMVKGSEKEQAPTVMSAWVSARPMVTAVKPSARAFISAVLKDRVPAAFRPAVVVVFTG